MPFLKIEIVPVAFSAVIVSPVVSDPHLPLEFYRQSLRVGECGHVFVALASAGCVFLVSLNEFGLSWATAEALLFVIRKQ